MNDPPRSPRGTPAAFQALQHQSASQLMSPPPSARQGQSVRERASVFELKPPPGPQILLPSQKIALTAEALNKTTAMLNARRLENLIRSLRDQEMKGTTDAILFAREKLSLADGTDECLSRERTFLLWLLLLLAEIERHQRTTPVDLLCLLMEQLIEQASTKPYEAHTAKLRFLLRWLFRPVLEQLLYPPAPPADPKVAMFEVVQAAKEVLEDFNTKRPKDLERRAIYLCDVVTDWKWDEAARFRNTGGKAALGLLDSLAAAMKNSRWSGEQYKKVGRELEECIKR